jgi:biotin--protein ligase
VKNLSGKQLLDTATTQVIYVYNDHGTSAASLKHTIYTLKSITIGYKIELIDAQGILNKPWTKNAILLIIPGGADLPYTQKLNGEGNRIIKKYVENGGNYLGICAGAYYGASFVEFDKDGSLEVVGERELAFFPNKAIGPILAKYNYTTNSGARVALIHINWKPKIKKAIPTTINVYYNGGGYFKDTNLHKNVNTIGYYQLENNTLLPAILKIKYKKGTVILSAVHFEYSPKLLNNDEYHNKLLPLLEENENDRIKFTSLIFRSLGIKTRM